MTASVTSRSDGRYLCPRHGVALVLETIKLSPFGQAMRTVEFYRCPVVVVEKTDVRRVLNGKDAPSLDRVDRDGRCTFRMATVADSTEA